MDRTSFSRIYKLLCRVCLLLLAPLGALSTLSVSLDRYTALVRQIVLFYTAVPNCPTCLIVLGAKLSSFRYGAKFSSFHYGAKLS